MSPGLVNALTFFAYGLGVAVGWFIGRELERDKR
jgi:hypothetical protein